MCEIISHERSCNLRVPSLQRLLELVDDIKLGGHSYYGVSVRGDAIAVSYRAVNVSFSQARR